jgi:uncharacterized membrane protein
MTGRGRKPSPLGREVVNGESVNRTLALSLSKIPFPHNGRVSRTHKVDPLWHVQMAVLVALALQIGLPERLVVGPRYVIPVLEGLLLLGLTFTTPKIHVPSTPRRVAAIAMIMLTTVANAASLSLLVRYLLKGGKAGGEELLLAGVNIFLTNVIVFGLWYWEIDCGGPVLRHAEERCIPDFLFPQYNAPDYCPDHWHPTFIDYLYVSATNATAFSPTDTLPLTHRAKLLMLAQSVISLITVALVTARAVNILS